MLMVNTRSMTEWAVAARIPDRAVEDAASGQNCMWLSMAAGPQEIGVLVGPGMAPVTSSQTGGRDRLCQSRREHVRHGFGRPLRRQDHRQKRCPDQVQTSFLLPSF